MSGDGLEIREVSPEDLADLRPILEEWVRNPETQQVIAQEVEDDLTLIGKIASGEDPARKYYVATENGKVVGGMGFQTDIDEQVADYAQTDSVVEVINAYVSGELRQAGVGRALIARIEREARALGYFELLVNSGPRYRESGWGFYDRVIGEKLGFIANYYGEGFDAAVWGEQL